MSKPLRSICAAACLLPSACSSNGGGPFGLVMFDPKHHIAGAGPLFGADEERCMTASFLLSALSTNTPESGEKPVCQTLRGRLQHALGFRDLFAPNSLTEPNEVRRRNEAVGALIAVSNDQCGQYVQFLQQYQGNVRSTSGIAAQTAAILATVSTGGVAKGFAAAAGISSGVGDNLYQAYFANQTVALLTKAFDNKRAEQLAHMDAMMQCSSVRYPLARAFADVQDYHKSCSIVVGLEQAQQAVEQKSSLTLDQFEQFMKKLPEVQKLVANKGAEIAGQAGDSSTGGSDAGGGTGGAAPVGSTGSSATATDSGSTGTAAASAPACPYDIAPAPAAAQKQQAHTAKPSAKKATRKSAKKRTNAAPPPKRTKGRRH